VIASKLNFLTTEYLLDNVDERSIALVFY